MMTPELRPHILFLIDVLYTPAGGAEGVLRRIVRSIPPERYRCSIATLATYPERVVKDSFPCPVHCLPLRRLWGWSTVRAGWALARLIREERVSVLHTFFEASDLLGAAVAKLSGCPVLISSRRDMGFKRSRAHRFAYRAAAPLFDQVQTVGEEVRRWHIERDGLDPRKVVTVRNGVDLDEIDAAVAYRPPEWNLPSEVPVVACVGNIRPIKGTEHLVRAAARVCREMPQTRFLVAGAVQDESYFRRVSDLALRLGVEEKIVFAGCRRDVPRLLKTCAAFFLPSLSEGLSNALLEAMACRLPCVAGRVGGNSEVIADGQSGFLTPVGDEQRSAGAILELLRNPSLAARMGRAGRQIVETRFSLQRMVSQLVELYDGLLGQPGGEGTGVPRLSRVYAEPPRSGG